MVKNPNFVSISINNEIREELARFMGINLLTSYTDAIKELLLDNELLKLENKRLRRRFYKENKCNKNVK